MELYFATMITPTNKEEIEMKSQHVSGQANTFIIELKKFSDLPATGSLNEAIMDFTKVSPNDSNGKSNYDFIYQDSEGGTVKIKTTDKYYDFWKSNGRWVLCHAS